MSSKKSLTFLRHAKSNWEEPGQSDHERTLNKRGRRAAPVMGVRMKEVSLRPDLVVTSSAVRATETTELVLGMWDYLPKVVTEPRLYLAEPKTYLELLKEIPSQVGHVLFVAHNPGISEIVSMLSGTRCEMVTASVAHVEFDVGELRLVTASSRGKLVHLLHPSDS